MPSVIQSNCCKIGFYECHYAVCLYAECRGAKLDLSSLGKWHFVISAPILVKICLKWLQCYYQLSILKLFFSSQTIRINRLFILSRCFGLVLRLLARAFPSGVPYDVSLHGRLI
jgi:hypothetical protein